MRRKLLLTTSILFAALAVGFFSHSLLSFFHANDSIDTNAQTGGNVLLAPEDETPDPGEPEVTPGVQRQLNEVRVLDIEPYLRPGQTTNSTLEGNIKSWAGNENLTVTITRMSSWQFVGDISNLRSDYDVIFIGSNGCNDGFSATFNELQGGYLYVHTGASKNVGTNSQLLGLFSGVYTGYTDNITDFYYSGNDITKAKMEEILAFAAAGGPVIVSSGLNNTNVDSASFISKVINDVKNDAKYSASYFRDNNFTDANKAKFREQLNRRGFVVTLLSQPVTYHDREYVENGSKPYAGYNDAQIYVNGSEDPSKPDKNIDNLDFKYVLEIAGTGTVNVTMLIDANSDGRFDEETEVLDGLEVTMIGNGNRVCRPGSLACGYKYSITRNMEDYLGGVSWKLIISSNEDTSLSYAFEGLSAIKKKSSDAKKKLNIVQIVSDQFVDHDLLTGDYWNGSCDNSFTVSFPTRDEVAAAYARNGEITSGNMATYFNFSAAKRSLYAAIYNHKTIWVAHWGNIDVDSARIKNTGMFYYYAHNMQEFDIEFYRINAEDFEWLVAHPGNTRTETFNYTAPLGLTSFRHTRETNLLVRNGKLFCLTADGKQVEADMIVMGYSDMYRGVKSSAALKLINDYVARGKSVLFTHDVTTFIQNDAQAWGYDFTQQFRNILGMDRYGALSNYGVLNNLSTNNDLPLKQGSSGFSVNNVIKENTGLYTETTSTVQLPTWYEWKDTWIGAVESEVPDILNNSPHEGSFQWKNHAWQKYVKEWTVVAPLVVPDADHTYNVDGGEYKWEGHVWKIKDEGWHTPQIEVPDTGEFTYDDGNKYKWENSRWYMYIEGWNETKKDNISVPGWEGMHNDGIKYRWDGEKWQAYVAETNTMKVKNIGGDVLIGDVIIYDGITYRWYNGRWQVYTAFRGWHDDTRVPGGSYTSDEYTWVAAAKAWYHWVDQKPTGKSIEFERGGKRFLWEDGKWYYWREKWEMLTEAPDITYDFTDYNHRKFRYADKKWSQWTVEWPECDGPASSVMNGEYQWENHEWKGFVYFWQDTNEKPGYAVTSDDGNYMWTGNTWVKKFRGWEKMQNPPTESVTFNNANGGYRWNGQGQYWERRGAANNSWTKVTDASTVPNQEKSGKFKYERMIAVTNRDDVYLAPVQGLTNALIKGNPRETFFGLFNANNMAQSTSVTRSNDGVLTEYPYQIPQSMTVAQTHAQYYQLDFEDEDIVVWYSLASDDTSSTYYNRNDVRNNYYIYNKGNITYSGVGHSKNLSENEAKLFINTMVAAYYAGTGACAPEVTNHDKSADKNGNQYVYVDAEILPAADNDDAYEAADPIQVGNDLTIKDGIFYKRVFFTLHSSAMAENKTLTVHFYVNGTCLTLNPKSYQADESGEMIEDSGRDIGATSFTYKWDNGESLVNISTTGYSVASGGLYYVDVPLNGSWYADNYGVNVAGLDGGSTLNLKMQIIMRYGKDINANEPVIGTTNLTIIKRGLFNLD